MIFFGVRIPSFRPASRRLSTVWKSAAIFDHAAQFGPAWEVERRLAGDFDGKSAARKGQCIENGIIRSQREAPSQVGTQSGIAHERAGGSGSDEADWGCLFADRHTERTYREFNSIFAAITDQQDKVVVSAGAKHGH